MADTSRPFMTLHYAQTLDGRIATRTGESQWISGEETLRFAHQLRADHDAVMVGVGTVIADDPQLTVRLVPGRSPLRIVLDSTLRLPLEARVLADGAAETLIATTGRAPEERVQAVRRQGAEVLVVEQDESRRVDLHDLLRRLADRGVSSVLVEGGSAVITSVFQQRLLDRLIVCLAPKLIGTGIEAVGNLNIRRMDDALQFAHAGFTTLGEDIIFDGRLAQQAVSCER